jgi:hypothetical protein
LVTASTMFSSINGTCLCAAAWKMACGDLPAWIAPVQVPSTASARLLGKALSRLGAIPTGLWLCYNLPCGPERSRVFANPLFQGGS